MLVTDSRLDKIRKEENLRDAYISLVAYYEHERKKHINTCRRRIRRP